MLRRIIGLVLVAVAVSATASAQEHLKPGETFRDCPECPEMVVIPAGSFMMGSPASILTSDLKALLEKLGTKLELPQHAMPRHQVTIPRAFALGNYEVTRAEFAAFVRDTEHKARGCFVYDTKGWKNDDSKDWRDPNFSQSERDPVVCVSWHDANQYARWLSRKTGHDYRLPSEAEWEYAARAGTTTARYWGEDADRACDYANVYDVTGESESGFRWEPHNCRDGYGNTAPVGSFRANGFGLHDVLGNVLEWVEDCWNDSYSGAPNDGGAWTMGKCSRRVIRGGSWLNDSMLIHAAERTLLVAEYRDYNVGFRIARTLP